MVPVARDEWRFSYPKNEYDPGGDELGAVEWSLGPATHAGRGPQGANSETGRKCGRFSSRTQIENGLGRHVLSKVGKWRPTETTHSGRIAPFVYLHYTTWARCAQPGEPEVVLRGGDGEGMT